MTVSARLRVAAISFLNPAPLMWDFDREPGAGEMRTRYAVQRMLPSECAAQLVEGKADLGLIPVAALSSQLRVVPGCAIASLEEVRSILLLIRRGSARSVEEVRTVAADTASRSSRAYVEVLFRHFLQRSPAFLQRSADPIAMLHDADAALLIGDPALHAREHRDRIEAVHGPCLWIDVAAMWHRSTGLPWVAAVWAVRPEALAPRTPANGSRLAEGRVTAATLIEDLQASRDHGLNHVEDLVEEWSPRLQLAPALVRSYLTSNIHYFLDDRSVQAILLFRRLAAEYGVLPRLEALRLLRPDGGTNDVASDFEAALRV